MMIKPCWNCTQVQDPANCDDSSCLRWQQWFAHTWDDMRHSLRVDMENRPKVPEGEVIGGVHYALPHRVQDYLNADPCGNCLCPKDLCRIPCRMKRQWLNTKTLLQ